MSDIDVSTFVGKDGKSCATIEERYIDRVMVNPKDNPYDENIAWTMGGRRTRVVVIPADYGGLKSDSKVVLP